MSAFEWFTFRDGRVSEMVGGYWDTAACLAAMQATAARRLKCGELRVSRGRAPGRSRRNRAVEEATPFFKENLAARPLTS
jgi:hypothetical protein